VWHARSTGTLLGGTIAPKDRGSYMLNFIFLALGVGGGIVSALTIADPWKWVAVFFFGIVGLVGAGLIVRDWWKGEAPAASAEIVLSNFRAQIVRQKFRITFTIKNSGPAVARHIKIDMQAGVGPATINNDPTKGGPIGTWVPTEHIVKFPDDLVAGAQIDEMFERALSQPELDAILGRPSFAMAKGAVTFNGSAQVPFNYLGAAKDGNFSKIISMFRPPQ
jgi:hypothetical protein